MQYQQASQKSDTQWKSYFLLPERWYNGSLNPETSLKMNKTLSICSLKLNLINSGREENLLQVKVEHIIYYCFKSAHILLNIFHMQYTISVLHAIRNPLHDKSIIPSTYTKYWCWYIVKDEKEYPWRRRNSSSWLSLSRIFPSSLVCEKVLGDGDRRGNCKNRAVKSLYVMYLYLQLSSFCRREGPALKFLLNAENIILLSNGNAS